MFYFIPFMYFSVAMSSFILSALLLCITGDCCVGGTHGIVSNISGSSRDTELSAKELDNFPLNHNTTLPSQEWYRCVHESRRSTKLQLQNCSLSHIHPRAFAKWPRATVRNTQKSQTMNSQIWIYMLYCVVSQNSLPVDIGNCTEKNGQHREEAFNG